MKALDIQASGFTFHFSKSVEFGSFVDGSVYIVAEPGLTLVAVTHSIKPNVLCELDPNNPAYQGLYDTTGLYATAYDRMRTLVLPRPISHLEIHSLVASANLSPSEIPTTPNARHVYEQVVLTTLPQAPSSPSFRPPYCGTPAVKAQFHFIDSINYALLNANRPIPAIAGTLASYTSYFSRVQYEYFTHNHVTNEGNISAGSIVTGQLNIPDGYGADRARIRSEAYLAASDATVPLEQRKPLLRALIQLGIDTYVAIRHGSASFVEAGGHGHGRWLPMAIAAWALQNKAMYEFAFVSARHRNATGAETYFEEFAHFYNSNTLNEVLFGMPEAYGRTYWTEYGHHEGAWLFKDPLERIDGGNDPGSAYQAIITGALTHLIFAATFNPNLFALIDFKMVMYAIRYATRGAICLPDPASAQRPNVAAFDRRRDYGHVSTQLFAELLPLLGAPPLSIKQV